MSNLSGVPAALVDTVVAGAGSPASSNGVIAVNAVSKSFGETRALDRCSLSVRSGEVHAIVGENGSGKSTLAKILSGVLAADNGSVSVLGATPTSPLVARQLGIATIFQEVLVADEMSVMDNLFVGLDGFFGSAIGAKERRRIAKETLQHLAQTNVDPAMPVGSMPLSLKQWIVIARALLTKPKVLILDESSAALDLDATARLHGEMLRLRDGGASVIIVTHRIAELVRIADCATVLRDGTVVGELRKSEINEHNLLTLMTPQTRSIPSVQGSGVAGRTAPNKNILLVKGLKVTPGGKPFSLDIKLGEIVGVVGLDGQGQNNFVRLLAGIGVSFGGEIVADYADPGSGIVEDIGDAERLRVSYVSGDRKREGIFPNLSIYENFAIGLYRMHLRPLGVINQQPIRQAFIAEVKRFSTKIGKSTNRITSLSGGNQQKILISRAFATDPKIVVLNDPARGVDLGTKRELYEELRKFAGRGGSVVYLSSELEELLGFADRVIVFFQGTVFRVLEGAEITEDDMLGAMFGRTGPVSFDDVEPRDHI